MADEKTVRITNADLPTHDDLTAPTILVDSISGVLSGPGVVVVGCTQSVLKVDSVTSMTPHRQVVLRLAIPVGSFPGMAKFFQDQLNKLIADGTIAPQAAEVQKHGATSE